MFILSDLPQVVITKHPSNVIQETNATNLTCVVTGTRLISLTWRKESDGSVLASSESIRIIPGTRSVCTKTSFSYWFTVTNWKVLCKNPSPQTFKVLIV